MLLAQLLLLQQLTSGFATPLDAGLSGRGTVICHGDASSAVPGEPQKPRPWKPDHSACFCCSACVPPVALADGAAAGGAERLFAFDRPQQSHPRHLGLAPDSRAPPFSI